MRDNETPPGTSEPAQDPRKFEFHPAADIFPLMDGEQFQALVADIRQHGVREPIVLHPDGSILDGRNRYLACQVLGCECPSVPWSGSEGAEINYVVSKNLHRRHLVLDTSRRALIAAKIATLKQGRPNKAGNLPVSPTQAEAAKTMQVSERIVRDAAKVLSEGSPEIIKAVEAGEMAVSAAADEIRARDRAAARQDQLDAEDECDAGDEEHHAPDGDEDDVTGDGEDGGDGEDDGDGEGDEDDRDAPAGEDPHPGGDSEDHRHGHMLNDPLNDPLSPLNPFNPLNQLVRRVHGLPGRELAAMWGLKVKEAYRERRRLEALNHIDSMLEGIVDTLAGELENLPHLPEIASIVVANLDRKIAKLLRLKEAVLAAGKSGGR